MGKAAERLNLRFYSLLAYGLGVWLGLQSFVNIAVNMGALPTKGLTLPLMSYGGSSMIVMCMVIGLLCRIHHETQLDFEDQLKGKSPWHYA
jgi:cell division protein FtsW